MDAAQCLEILSSRKKCDAEAPCHGCDAASAAASSSFSCSTEDPAAGGAKAVADLSELSTGDLIRAFQLAQEERVIAYREFNDMLAVMLRTAGGCAGYPVLVAEMTARFAALSRGITLGVAALATRGEAELARLIRDVQSREQEKLLLVASLHLETIRRSQLRPGAPNCGAIAGAAVEASHLAAGDAEMAAALRGGGGLSSSSSGGGNAGGGAAGEATGVVALLKEESMALERKVQAVIADINELLDDIKCEAMEAAGAEEG